MESLKGLPMLQSVRVEIVYMQYNISDSQALCCFVLIILRMAGLNTVLMFCRTASLALLLFFLFLLAKIKAFVRIKLFL